MALCMSTMAVEARYWNFGMLPGTGTTRAYEDLPAGLLELVILL